MINTVLLVDDEENARTALSLALKRDGYNILTAASGDEGMTALDNNPVDILVTDMIMPRVSGLDLLRYAKERHPEVMVVMVTGYASVESAITALKEGAFDYITKPVKLEEVRITLQQACEKRKLLIENLLLKQQLKGRYAFDRIIGASAGMKQVYQLMERVLDTDTTVLIQGESGTGKELVAKALHYNGLRKDKPFVAINCAAIPSELLESELFGHLKGSFTGAVANKAGKFQLADSGTLFLDEIASMTLPLQGKILRAIQEREVESVGGSKPVKVDVRIISATNRDLEEAVAAGEFREDLFYRLNVIPIHLPPLRERLEDLPLLAVHFLKKFNDRTGRKFKGLTSAAMDCMAAHDWPGNIRELENFIERVATLTDSEYIDMDSLPPSMRRAEQNSLQPNLKWIPDTGIDMPGEVGRFETAMIMMALKKSDGVKSRAAGLLGIKRTTLIEKMKRLGL